MKTAYLFALSYFSAMSLLLLASGVWIFVENIGFSIEAVVLYYAGDATAGVSAKSLYGQLEVAVPHLGAMGLFIMVVTHFLLFAPKKRRKHLGVIAICTFAAALLNIASGIAVSSGWLLFASVKLAAFALFCAAALFTVGLLLYETLRTLHRQRYV